MAFDAKELSDWIERVNHYDKKIEAIQYMKETTIEAILATVEENIKEMPIELINTIKESMPDMNTHLRISKALKEQLGIKTSLMDLNKPIKTLGTNNI